MESTLWLASNPQLMPGLAHLCPAVTITGATILDASIRQRRSVSSWARGKRMSRQITNRLAANAAVAPHPPTAPVCHFAPTPPPDHDHHPAHSTKHIDVQGYVEAMYHPYGGDESFLAPPTQRTLEINAKIAALVVLERERGVLDVDPTVPSTITAFGPGYIDKEKEVVVGLQCDAPFKRAIKPLGGTHMVREALKAYGFPVDEETLAVYERVRKTHNQGVFDVYTDEMRRARKASILTGLPDGYGRGRIIGDYRRVALYGVDKLIEAKRDDLHMHLVGVMTEERIRLREEVQEQIRALKELKDMAASYGFDVGRPAETAREAVQWLYFAYLAAVKEQDGAAMSLGRVDAFLDTYIERDLAASAITEEEAQELIDQLVQKLRIVKQLRTPDFNALFTGDPTWVTASLGGMDAQGRSAVTKTTYRFLRTLQNLGPAPEPNLTVLWNSAMPEAFKRYCARISIETSSVQYENDMMMRTIFGDDYGIACCVSAMRIGKDMQFFGARCNLPKLLLYVLNGGRDEVTGEQVGPQFDPVPDGPLRYEDVVQRLDKGMDWLMRLYADTMNIIHYMHDKYNYERLEMALHDTDVRRFLAFGVSGLSVIADSLSAIKHARVTPLRNADGIATEFDIEGDFPKFGNDDERVDGIARWVLSTTSRKLKGQHAYRHSIPTLSALTITSNVVYGLKTGSTPDGRNLGEPFAPGANPMHGREVSGALASLTSIAKLPFEDCLDGISNTFTLVPTVLGKEPATREAILYQLLDGYFQQRGHHVNVNVLSRDTLIEAMDHPERYPNLTIRVSGYAVHFNKLTRAQQEEVIARTFHATM